MIWDAALIMTSCVLFVQMGLSEAIQEVLHIHLRIASCPKCLTMWTTLVYLLFSTRAIVLSVAVSFVFSYLALWMSLLYDIAAGYYNKLYETISKTPDASETSFDSDTEETCSDEVS